MNKQTLNKHLIAQKKAYQAPKLTYHGLVTKLTTGGTGTASEGNMGGVKPRPTG